MKIAIPSRETFEGVNPITQRSFKNVYFGSVLDHNLPISTSPEWDDAKSYNIGDVVKIDSLKGEYISLIDNNTTYPPISSSWNDITVNEYRFRNAKPTAQTESTDNIVVDFDVTTNDIVVGMHLEEIERVLIQEIDEQGSIIRDLYNIEMANWVFFDCFSCCNLHEIKTNFSADLDGCGFVKKIRVSLLGSSNKNRKVGVLAVAKKHDIGCLVDNAEISNQSTSKYEVEMGDLAFQGGSSLAVMTGTLSLDIDRKKIVSDILDGNQNKLNFYVIDEHSIILGSHYETVMPLNSPRDTTITYEINIKGVK